jgi:hypothetical protein
LNELDDEVRRVLQENNNYVDVIKENSMKLLDFCIDKWICPMFREAVEMQHGNIEQRRLSIAYATYWLCVSCAIAVR